jgi:hypothetical protein
MSLIPLVKKFIVLKWLMLALLDLDTQDSRIMNIAPDILRRLQAEVRGIDTAEG